MQYDQCDWCELLVGQLSFIITVLRRNLIVEGFNVFSLHLEFVKELFIEVIQKATGLTCH